MYFNFVWIDDQNNGIQMKDCMYVAVIIILIIVLIIVMILCWRKCRKSRQQKDSTSSSQQSLQLYGLIQSNIHLNYRSG